MSTLPLVRSLNALLVALHIPIPLTSPTDLTPSLLLAIASSLLRTRIVPPQATLESESEHERQLQTTKLFLGVLQTDMLSPYLSFSEIKRTGVMRLDPGRVVQGRWHELVFLGKMVCWVARRRKVLVDSDITLPDNVISDTELTATPTGFSLHSKVNKPISTPIEYSSIPQRATYATACSNGPPSPSCRRTPPLPTSLVDNPGVGDSWMYETCPILPTLAHLHPKDFNNPLDVNDGVPSAILTSGFMSFAEDIPPSSTGRTAKKRTLQSSTAVEPNLRVLLESHEVLLEERATLLELIAAEKLKKSTG
ncbi:hypothetical protein DL96DRAFT_1602129 [Flagelloscypha sp. PMI_526]|nr:hypothetical protein DL96DRAFT_1602129 [Flagelloscypha sp. PMI_526]